MKKIPFGLGLLLLFSVCALAQQISKSNPLGGEIKEIYANDGPRVLIQLEFLKEEDANFSVPVTNVSNVKMTIVSLTEKLPNGQQKLTAPNKDVAPEAVDNATPLKREFELNISNSTTGAAFRLPKNWDSFSYRISVNVANEALPKSTAVLSMQKPSEAVTGQNFTVKLNKPIWIKAANLDRSAELIIPISSTSASLAAEIELRQGDQGPNTKKTVFLPKGEQTSVKLNVQNFGVAPIQIRIKPTELEGLQLTLTGLDCSNTSNDPFCSWSPEFKEPFQINREDSDFKTLKITSLAQPRTIQFRTTSPAKPGTMTAKLNGNPITVVGTSNPYQIVLDTGMLNEGENTIEIEGESSEGGLKLLEKSFKFEKITKPTMVGYPEFEVDNSGSFKVKYKLKGDIDLTAPGELKLVYKDADSKLVGGVFGIPTCTVAVDGVTPCSAATSITLSNLDAQFKDKQLIPVVLTISSKERSAPNQTQLQTLGFNLINQAAIKKILDDVRTQWKAGGGNNKPNNNKARASIAKDVFLERLSPTDDQVNDAFEKYINQEDASDKRKKYLQFLIGIGNFALKGFGVPIQIPIDLAN
jgi:hypothetical protein